LQGWDFQLFLSWLKQRVSEIMFEKIAVQLTSAMK